MKIGDNDSNEYLPLYTAINISKSDIQNASQNDNSIFDMVDSLDEKKDGCATKSGIEKFIALIYSWNTDNDNALSTSEIQAGLNNIDEDSPLAKLKNMGVQVVEDFIKKFITANNINLEKIGINLTDTSEASAIKATELLKREESVVRLQKKWCGTWKSSPLKAEFFRKLFEIIPKLNLKVDKFDSENFYSEEEQIADRLCCLFAQESGLNPSVNTGKYAGLFQLSGGTISSVKTKSNELRNQGIMSDQDVSGNFNSLSGFAMLKGEQQLEWLIAFCESKGILNEPKTVDELAAKIKCISFKNAEKHGCSTRSERAGQILDKCMTKNSVPIGTKYLNI